MSPTTNQLVVKAKRLAIPVGAVLTLLFVITFFFNYTGVHAASYAASPLDDNNVSSLVSLDNAVEAVAAKVTPAVVNVAVTSRGSEEHGASDSDDQGQIQGLPPGFAQFFGSGRRHRRSSMASVAASSSLPMDISSPIITSSMGQRRSV